MQAKGTARSGAAGVASARPPSEENWPSSDGTDELVSGLLTASRVLVGVSARSLAELEDTVTLSQFRTLVVVRTHGATRLNDLAARLGVGSSTALRTVDRLVAASLLSREDNPHDRREVVIDLTARGRELVEQVTARRRTAIAEIVRAMPKSQARGLIHALEAFAAAADEPGVAEHAATRLGW